MEHRHPALSLLLVHPGSCPLHRLGNQLNKSRNFPNDLSPIVRNGFLNGSGGLSASEASRTTQQHNSTKLVKPHHARPPPIAIDTSLEIGSSYDQTDDNRRPSRSSSELPVEANKERIRQVVIQESREEDTRDGPGIQWREAIRCITDESGPQDRLVKYVFARRLTRNGFTDRGAFRSVLEFIQSLTNHVDTEELRCALDSITYIIYRMLDKRRWRENIN